MLRRVCAHAGGLLSPSTSAKHQSETLQLTTWGRSRALIQALIAEAHRAFQVGGILRGDSNEGRSPAARSGLPLPPGQDLCWHRFLGLTCTISMAGQDP